MILGWATFFAGLAGVLSIVGLYRPGVFERFGVYGSIVKEWFSSPPALLRSMAWLGVFVFVFYHVSPLIAMGILALWALRFPDRFDAFANTWIEKFGLTKQIPWRMGDIFDWLEDKDVFGVDGLIITDIVAVFVIWFGVWVFVDLNVVLSLILIGAGFAVWAYIKHVGYDREIMKALGAF